MKAQDMVDWLSNVLQEHDSTHQTLKCFYVMKDNSLVLELTNGRQFYVGVVEGKVHEFVKPNTKAGVEETIVPGEKDTTDAF